MATSPSVFSFAHIALTATITAVVALLVLVVLRPRFKILSLVDCLLIAVVVGISVIVWRLAGNTEALNNDTIPGVSPNDVLCPLVTYLFIALYAAFRPRSMPCASSRHGRCSPFCPLWSMSSRSNEKEEEKQWQAN